MRRFWWCLLESVERIIDYEHLARSYHDESSFNSRQFVDLLRIDLVDSSHRAFEHFSGALIS